ncbi:Transcriptional regulatory protein ZraR [Pseudoalteromonas holothuriae]|uniref:Transcriptional regulatory protein ZraR n=1 Tax=Pseudoalteromonas holothuriae TaxID=2963714 RepID=A0A9W4QQL3_9GAMM|nr:MULTISPECIES: sigma-54 dependent transcriptional regulator [unclassified Pseudoalteromonas]CAH9049414.1 Transcriptional regulatory protein ZraR [Pseudoalteromonas sp. CIP111854]CAH9056019.1 Transcriptional regulatory protein ZraR [Pseudoalteromonas sp. CIP111951]
MAISEKAILVVDDNKEILVATRMLLKPHYKKVMTLDNPHDIANTMAKQKFALILLDMNFTRDSTSGAEGFYWLKQIKTIDEDAVVVLFTAFGDMSMAVDAIKQGASDFVLKPWQNEKLLATVANCVELNTQRQTNKKLNQIAQLTLAAQNKPFENLIAASPAMEDVFQTIEKAAKTDANVLVLGESGTGKELIARELHKQSLRAKQTFLSVDMGTIASSLFESELFGHVKGAFTDAKENKQGRFELADDGTLFLDEIANIPLALQGKLLTAIQNTMITPVGGSKQIDIDIRLITATNVNLYDMVQSGNFRQDLLYRINTVEITLPPLRERLHDIPLLVEFYTKLYSEKYKLGNKFVDDKTMQSLIDYPWPGNIRELQHLAERAVILSESAQLQFQLSNKSTQIQSMQKTPNTYNLAELEQHTIERAIKDFKGNISHAAKALGITRASLYRKMEKFGV